MVTGTPEPMRKASQRIDSRAEPDAAVRDGGAGHAADVGDTVDPDLPGPPANSCEHGGARAQRERERRAGVGGPESDRLLDVELARRCRGRRLADDRGERPQRVARRDRRSPLCGTGRSRCASS